jgi:hypothetical protein
MSNTTRFGDSLGLIIDAGSQSTIRWTEAPEGIVRPYRLQHLGVIRLRAVNGKNINGVHRSGLKEYAFILEVVVETRQVNSGVRVQIESPVVIQISKPADVRLQVHRIVDLINKFLQQLLLHLRQQLVAVPHQTELVTQTLELLLVMLGQLAQPNIDRTQIQRLRLLDYHTLLNPCATYNH